MAEQKRKPVNWQLVARNVLLGAIPFLVLAGAWICAVHVYHVKPIFLPPLEKLPQTLVEMFVEDKIHKDILVSVFRVLAGFLLAVILATPLGMLMGYNKHASQTFAPFMGFIRYLPVPVFVPLTLLWFGSGDPQKMSIIFLGAFFQLVLMIEDAAKNVPPEYYEAARMLGAPRYDLVLRVLLPASAPQIFDSYRICIGWAWTYLVVAELVGASNGIGYFILRAQRYLLVPKIFAAMLIIGILGLLTDLLFIMLSRLLFRWKTHSR
ncbi:ABC transporter permease [bacterium]|nr:ABC transporter permease [bacterium]